MDETAASTPHLQGGKGLLRETKKLMVSKGHTCYQPRKLGRVPREAVEELLGIRFQGGQAERTSCTPM